MSTPSTCFNPRARTGRDVRQATGYTSQRFQSTRPYGARRRMQIVSRSQKRVSIHAPVRGATIVDSSCARRFQSTRPYGARPAMTYSSVSTVFQSTRPYGARQSSAYTAIADDRFNPRARTGRDGRHDFMQSTTTVSIHAPVRGAT